MPPVGSALPTPDVSFEVRKGVTYHDQALCSVVQAPRLGDVQDARRVRLRRAEVARDDGGEGVGGEEGGEEVGDGEAVAGSLDPEGEEAAWFSVLPSSWGFAGVS